MRLTFNLPLGNFPHSHRATSARGSSMQAVQRFLRSAVLPGALLLAVSGCTTQTVERPLATGPAGGVAPVLSVERFLQAVNAEDFAAMARIFGNVEGPVRGPADEVELRMATIAAILKHEDYRIGSERLEPGRRNPTRRVGVDLTIDGNVIPDVSFLVVQSSAGNWLVEQIDLERVTRG